MWPSGAVAQSTVIPAAPTGALPTDVTPIRLREERELFRPGPSLYLFQRLPANLWFNTSTEVNLRYESNVFLTANQPRRDLVFRTFPNVTVGYNFLKNTGIYSNYFLIKDIYGDTYHGTAGLTRSTTQSVSMGLRHSRQIRSTNVQFDVQARELWQARKLHQFDYLPGFLLSRSLTPKTYGFINLQLQMRGGQPFIAPDREIDPFYTVGLLRSFGLWTLSVTDTFITDFRSPPFHTSIPHHSNAEMIADIELYHPIVKRYPNVVGFVRAEPIWNWHSNREAGLSGFDFRVYSGIRVTFAKPPVGSLVNQMRQNLKNSPDSATPGKDSPESSPTTPGTTQPIPNSSTPTPINTAYSGESNDRAGGKKLIAGGQKPAKTSFMQRLKLIALGPENPPANQGTIVMIANPMNPLGPMIPTLVQTQQPPVASQVTSTPQSASARRSIAAASRSQSPSPSSSSSSSQAASASQTSSTPEAPPVVLRGNIDPGSTSARPVVGPTQIPLREESSFSSNAPTALPDSATDPFASPEAEGSSAQSSKLQKAQTFTGDLHLGTAFDSCADCLKAKSLLPLEELRTIID
jgi:hypothetical protein